MAELKPYPAYKDSGVEWIGEIPEDWETLDLKRLFNLVYRYPTYYGIDYIDTGVLEVRGEMLVGNGMIDIERIKPRYISSQTSSKFPLTQLKSGDIVMSVRGTMGKIGLVNEELSGSNITANLLRLSPNHKIVYPRYLQIVMESKKFTEELDNQSDKTTIRTITVPKLLKINISLPTLNEQKKIIEFIEGKTSELDLLISDKKRLIELLEEKRQAIITETVTKGLNPKVKMKDSGIEWIGEIPEHWEVIRLKNLMKLNPPKSEVNKDKDIKVTFIPMEKLLSNGEVDYSLSRHISEVYNGYTYFKNNDIVMAKVTPCFENGNIALVEDLKNGIGFGTTELHVLRANKNIKSKYLYYLLRTEYFKQEGVSTMYGVGGLKRIPAQFILDYKIGLPSKKEQEEILEYIDEVNKDIYILMNQQREIIKKLKEYRESLIYEAVTGKIDLRDYEVDASSDVSYAQVAETKESYNNND